MKADTVDLASIFGKPVHYVVPLYQRPYVWTREKQWEHLWDDIREVADRQLDDTPGNDSIPHFLGAVVLEQALVGSGMIDCRTIIDGQQRLTTLQLVVAAARSIAAERELDEPRQMFEKLLFNENFLVHHEGDQYKVLPTERDRAAFREAVGDGVIASSGSHRMHEAYRFFRGAISRWTGDEADAQAASKKLKALSTAIWKRLILVSIDLEPGDNPQVIFETLNALGTPLAAADLVKNHLFQTATMQGANVERLYQDYWRELDSDWWREEVQQGRLKRPRVDIFLNHWLAMSGNREVVTHQLFPEFKRYLADGQKQATMVLADLDRYRRVYERFEKESQQTRLGRFLYRLRMMEVTTAYPMILWLLGPDGISDAPDQVVALDAIESWLVRRLLARLTTKNYNTVFLSALRYTREQAAGRGGTALAQDIVDFLASLAGESQVWPRAAAVRSSLRTLAAYQVFPVGRLRMLLEALEEAMYTGFTEKVIPTDLTVEHVLPQEWQANWPLPAEADPFQARLDRDAAKHRLGNLTLVTGRLNPRMSNGPWEAKQEALRTLSLMQISTDIRNASSWDEAAISARGERLTDLAVGFWRRPDDEAEAADAESDRTAGQKPEIQTSPRLGPPDPDNPSAFESVLGIADEVGVGEELRKIIAVSRELGLWPRPDRYSVIVCPPADRRVMLFTVWPQWDDGGSFRIWKSPTAFSRFIPNVTLEAAQSTLGASEEGGVLPFSDTDALLEAVRRLVGDQDLAHPMAIQGSGPEGEGFVPAEILALISLRSSDGTAILARKLAEEAAAMPGVQLRPQQSKNGRPWYFQVRHPNFSQVVSYVHPRPAELHIEYRLPPSHNTYGIAVARDNFYEIVLKVTAEADLPTALQLLRDAISRTD